MQFCVQNITTVCYLLDLCKPTKWHHPVDIYTHDLMLTFISLLMCTFNCGVVSCHPIVSYMSRAIMYTTDDLVSNIIIW